MPMNLSTRDLLLLVGLPAISDFAGNLIASNASGRAADTQVAATERAAELNRETGREALELQRQIYNDQVRRAEPYRQGGLSGLSRLLQWSGLPAPVVSPAGEIPGLPAMPGGGSTGSPRWTPPASESRGGSSWVPAAVNTAGTLGSLALLGGGGTAGAGAAGAGGTLGTLGRFATNPYTLAAAAAGLGAMGWLKSQAHWEANDAVQTFENPFHYEFLAPLNRALATGQIQPQEAVRLLDENWRLYQQKIQEWAGRSSDRQRAARQSISNPQLVATVEGIRQNALAMPPGPAQSSLNVPSNVPTDWESIARRYQNPAGGA